MQNEQKQTGFLQDDKGNESSGRLMSLICTLSAVALSVAVTSVCLFKSDYAHAVEMVIALGGLGLGHKVNNTVKERFKG